MTDHEPTDDLIARVLAGEATDEDRRALEAWTASAAGRQERLDRVRRAWAGRAARGEWDVDRAWARVSAQVESLDHEVDVIPIPRAPGWRTTAWRVAAALVVVCGVAFAWRAIGGGPMTYVTVTGEVRDIALADGTQVTLAPDSRLRVPRDLAADRTLHLEGEGWFAVGDRGTAVFEVRAGDYVVRDVGTSFTLRSRKTDSLQVVVVSGAVIVTRDGRVVGDTLSAGTVAGIGGDALTRQPGDVRGLTAWRDGSLEFVAVPAAAIVARLSEWHGTPIVIEDRSLATRPITVTFSTGSLDDALDVVALLLGVKTDRDAGRIVLR